MTPIILDNILTKQECKDMIKLYNLIQSEPFKYFEKTKFDRHSIHAPAKLLSIAKRLKPIVEQLVGASLRYSIAMISCYKEGGKCPPHFDTKNNEFGLAICIKKNIDWLFYVDGTGFNIQENQAILFNGYKSEHYREGILGLGNSFCIAFLHFGRLDEEND